MDEVGGGIFVFGFDVVIYVVVVDVIFLFVKLDKYNVIVVINVGKNLMLNIYCLLVLIG